jgi:transcriptional regulator with XRE-family HTH domain
MAAAQNIVGPQVRALRARAELTQDALAARCGVLGWDLSRGGLAKIEAQVRCVSDAEVYVLARALRAPLDDLYPRHGPTVLAHVAGERGR